MPRKACISGVYDTAVGVLTGSSCMGLHAEAARGAAADAGVAFDDIDGVLCGYSLTEPHMMLSSVLCEYAGLHPTFTSAIQVGGATGAIMVMHAAALVESGHCRHVLCVGGDNRVSALSSAGAVTAVASVGHPQFEYPFGMSVPAAYALVAQRYMHEFGATPEHLAAIAVTTREHALRHPNAHMKDRITMDDVANSRIISSPLRLLDCCLISDGAAGILISAADAAADTKAPIEILGSGQGHTHEHIFAAPSLTHFGCSDSAPRAFVEAGVEPKDIDVAEIYDSFTITLLIELESMGFFEKGEAGEAALNGALDLGGALPCNTHGGLLSYGAAGAAGGMFHITEGVRQLRGEADTRQVEGAQLALVHGDGGILSAHGTMILGSNR